MFTSRFARASTPTRRCAASPGQLLCTCLDEFCGVSPRVGRGLGGSFPRFLRLSPQGFHARGRLLALLHQGRNDAAVVAATAASVISRLPSAFSPGRRRRRSRRHRCRSLFPWFCPVAAPGPLLAATRDANAPLLAGHGGLPDNHRRGAAPAAPRRVGAAGA